MTTTGRRIANRLPALLIPLLLLATLVGWAFASPVGSSPDDPMHLPSIWCGAGERDGLCERAADNPDTLLVPRALVTAPCFAFAAEQSGACWDPSDLELVEPHQINSAGDYPPVFYAVMSVFASENIEASVIAMRIFNSLLAIGAFTAIFWLSPRSTRASAIVPMLATAVPLGLFIVPSTNPSSWAYVSAGIVWSASFGALNSTGRRMWLLWVFAVVGTLMGAGARADAAAYSVLAVVLAIIVSARFGRALIAPAVACGAIVAVAASLFLTASQTRAVTSGLPGFENPLSPGQIVSNALSVPSLWIGALGGWGLGWLDTLMPGVVTIASFAVASGAIFIGLRRITPRRATALLLALIAAWAVPFVVLYQSNAVVGQQVQPRYILPILVLVVGVASADLRIVELWRGPRLLTAAIGLSVAAAVALHVNIRRYTTGVEDSALDPGQGAEWWWPVAPSALSVWAFSSISLTVALMLLWWTTTRFPRAADDGLVHGRTIAVAMVNNPGKATAQAKSPTVTE